MNVMVMDVEGTDGRERGEDQVCYPACAIHTSLCLLYRRLPPQLVPPTQAMLNSLYFSPHLAGKVQTSRPRFWGVRAASLFIVLPLPPALVHTSTTCQLAGHLLSFLRNSEFLIHAIDLTFLRRISSASLRSSLLRHRRFSSSTCGNIKLAYTKARTWVFSRLYSKSTWVCLARDHRKGGHINCNAQYIRAHRTQH